ncbi:SDR family NAD(P)-dependent oxidoreductase [Effusibacillus dendaii]|uniref:Short chain dehydrogenase n=1 Tax=Effusibacillus dendaii TaxID=2743772 RepID=A0A7I8DAV8_9BACL|nr:SDR family oxidoreductase [Effusibacillus dendaii]BCJ85041.1 short chain dehydrogenase [Effusibacillus dendaii]
MRFQDKVAIVTGAASGIGRASVLEFARGGARVVAADVNREGGEQTVAAVKTEGGEAIFIETDTSSYESVQSLVDQAVGQYGRLDIMFNNAGVGSPLHNVLDMPVDEYLKVVSINQHGVFYGIKAAGNAMKERGGVIINTASIYAYIADRGKIPYHASKGAVVSMTKAAALDLAKFNIRVVGIAPGLIDTGIVTRWKGDEALWNKIQRAQMRGKAGKPEEVAKVVAFLASEDASFLNGHIYCVDDGAAAFKR